MQADTATYTKANLCSGLVQGTGFFDPGSIHTANMTSLEPSTRYFYIYGSDVSPPSFSHGRSSLQPLHVEGELHHDVFAQGGPHAQVTLCAKDCRCSVLQAGLLQSICGLSKGCPLCRLVATALSTHSSATLLMAPLQRSRCAFLTQLAAKARCL